MSPIQIATLFVLSVGAFVLTLSFRGVAPDWSWLTYVGLPSAAVTAIVTYFVASAWKWPLLYGWFVHRPDLSGEWIVKVESNFIPEGATDPIAVDGRIKVVQTFNRLLVCFESPESTGDPIAASIEVDEAKQVRLAGVFRNDVEFKARDKMRGHFGAYLLKVESGQRPERMSGVYWNDRGNAGTLVATRA